MASGPSLADRFEATVDTYGGFDAIDGTDRTLTFDELDARANRVAHWLLESGLDRGDRVGIALWNRPEHLEVLLGTFKAGMIPVNVNCRYTTVEIEALLADADARLVVHEATSTLRESEPSSGRCWTRVALGPDYEAALASRPATRPEIARSGDDGYILYTGGSTGTPKGVVWNQADLFAATMSPSEARRPGSRLLPASPLTHGTAQWTTLSTLLSAGTVVFGPLHSVDAEALWTRVAEGRVTRLVIVGDAFARPLADMLDANPGRWDLSELVAITSGGARWSTKTQDRLLTHLPHVAMVNSFGASETGGQGAQVRFAGQPATHDAGLIRFSPDDTTTVVDEQLRPVPPGSGAVGVLAQHGAVPTGYFHDSIRSRSTFPIVDGVRYSIPGDLAMVDANGDIIVLGRDQNVINTGGEKVYAEEVEARLLSHPMVADTVVVGIDDERWGQAIAALVLPTTQSNVTSEELRAHCAATLARFKLPRRIEFVRGIRHLPNGKLDRSWATDTMATIVAANESD